MVLVALLLSINSCNHSKKQKHTVKTASNYNFPLPKNWTEEKIAFPIEFAPQINYTGFENLRFAPGWEFTTSAEHWSYAFLWWLNDKPNIDRDILINNLNTYYTGLVGRNVKIRHIPASKLVPVVTALQKTTTQQDDLETYEGTVVITDYLDINYNPITLNIRIHKKDCSHTAFIFQISPKPPQHNIWQQLNMLNREFKCDE